MKNKKSGFTLVELMIVAVIVAILAAVAIPLTTANKKRAMATEAEAALGTIRSALRAMYVQTGAYNVDLSGNTIANGSSPLWVCLSSLRESQQSHSSDQRISQRRAFRHQDCQSSRRK